MPAARDCASFIKVTVNTETQILSFVKRSRVPLNNLTSGLRHAWFQKSKVLIEYQGMWSIHTFRFSCLNRLDKRYSRVNTV